MAKRSKRADKQRRNVAAALLTAAAAIPTLFNPARASGEGPPQNAALRLQYSHYRDWQAGDQERIEVDAPMAWFVTPLGESSALEGSLVYDSISGASPLYHNTLSGASGRGIRDQRRAGDLKFTHYFDGYSLGVGGSFSNEDDYDAYGGLVELGFWTPDRNRSFTLALSGGRDSISSSNDPQLDESLRAFGAAAGITQIINPRSAIQSNLTYASKDGYQSDPYKLDDLRPRSREQWAWLTRYMVFFPQYEASWHIDYRLYADTWAVAAHTVESSWHQPFADSWIIVPRVRLYSQSAAEFFRSRLRDDFEGNSFFSADHRLAAFGGITLGGKIIYSASEKVQLSVAADWLQQRPTYRLFGNGSANMSRFEALMMSVACEYKF